jgi:hypothetical protein
MTTRFRFSALTGALLLAGIHVHGQELTLNPANNYYEYSAVKPLPASATPAVFAERLAALNYRKLMASGDSALTADGFTSHLVGGFANVEIFYTAKLMLRQGRYRLTLTNFVLTDKNGSNRLEGMGAFKKKWVRIINEKLPAIVSQFEATTKTDDKW